jgi:hypothetical protein
MPHAMDSARRFDSELQMFCEAVREPSLVELRFLRWLAERGRLEHPVVGEPAGVYAEDGDTSDDPHS